MFTSFPKHRTAEQTPCSNLHQKSTPRRPFCVNTHPAVQNVEARCKMPTFTWTIVDKNLLYLKPKPSLWCEYCGHRTGVLKRYIKQMIQMYPFNHPIDQGCLYIGFYGILKRRNISPVILTTRTPLWCEYCGHHTGSSKSNIKQIAQLYPFNRSGD